MSKCYIFLILLFLIVSCAQVQPLKTPANQQAKAEQSQVVEKNHNADRSREEEKALPSADSPWLADSFTVSGPDMAEAVNEASKPYDNAVVILLSDEHIKYKQDGSRVRVKRMLYQIKKESAFDAWGRISWSWSPWYQKRPQLRARTYSATGEVNDLDPKLVVDAASKADSSTSYSNNRVIRAPFPAIQEGVVVEWEVRVEESQPFFLAGIAEQRFWGYRSHPILKERLVLDTPKTINLRIQGKENPLFSTHKSIVGKRNITSISSGLLLPLGQPENNMPSDQTDYHFLGFSTGESWQEIATAYSEIVNQQLNSEDLSELAKQIAGTERDPKKLTDLFVTWIRKNIKYNSINLSDGGQIPRKPSTAIETQYGDCKDNATLLCGLLREFNVAAHVALLKTGPSFEVQPELPGMGLFNHAIVYIPTNPPIWVDPTDHITRAGELPLFDQGRLALIADSKSTKLVLTPLAPSTQNSSIEQRQITLVEKGKSKIEERTTYGGAWEREIRASYLNTDQDTVDKTLGDYLTNNYGVSKNKECSTSNSFDMHTPFTITVKGDGMTTSASDGTAAVAHLQFSPIFNRLPEFMRTKAPATTRSIDFQFAEAFSSEIHYKVVPPPTYQIRGIPKSEEFNIGKATISKSFEVDEAGALQAKFRFDLGSNRFTPESFRKLHEKVYELVQSQAVSSVYYDERGSVLRAKGKIKEALSEYRKYAKIHPNPAFYLTKVSEILRELGLVESAREAAKKAVEISPLSSEAHYELGFSNYLGYLGRPRGHGFNNKISLSAIKRSHELNNAAIIPALQYAISLEYNEKGERYGEGSDLLSAAELYKEFADKNEGIKKNLYVNMLSRKAGDELITITDKFATVDEAQFHILGVYLKDGVDAAINTASQRLTNLKQRSKILMAVGAELGQQRMYADAIKFYQAAIPNAEKPAQLRRFTQNLVACQLLNSKQPESAIHSFYYEFIDALVKQKNSYFESICTPDFFKQIKEDEELSTYLKTIAKNSIGENKPMLIADVMKSKSKLLVRGSDQLGYRVSTRVYDNLFQLYIRKSGSEYRLAALGSHPSTVIKAISMLAENAEIDATRQWLDWGREGYSTIEVAHPMLASPYALLWEKGADKPTEEVLTITRLLKAAYTADSESITFVNNYFSSLPEKPAYADAVNFGVLQQLLSQKKCQQVLDHIELHFDPRPDVVALDFLYLLASFELGEISERNVEHFTKLRNRFPSSSECCIIQSMIHVKRGNLEESIRVLEEFVIEHSPSLTILNELAWKSLFFDQSNKREHIDGVRSAILRLNDPLRLRAYSHTLASLLAKEGDCKEALQVLRDSVPINSQLESGDWIVIGLIAEQLGETEAALKAYAKTIDSPEGESGPLTSKAFAKSRVQLILSNKKEDPGKR